MDNPDGYIDVIITCRIPIKLSSYPDEITTVEQAAGWEKDCVDAEVTGIDELMDAGDITHIEYKGVEK